jgi:hypothetical protein
LTIQDSRSTPTTSVNVLGGYTEGSNSDTTTSAIYLNGIGQFNGFSYKLQYEDNASTAPMVEYTYSGSQVPVVNVIGANIFNATTYPVACAIKNDITSACTTSDSHGYFSQLGLGVTKTCGATIVVQGGIITSC